MKTPGVYFPNNLQSLDFNNNISHYREIVNNQHMQNGEKNAPELTRMETKLPVQRKQILMPNKLYHSRQVMSR